MPSTTTSIRFQATRDNLALNPWVTAILRTVDALSSDLVPRDLVIDNLMGDLLIQMAGWLHDLTTASTRPILSGFLPHEETGVRVVYLDLVLSSRTQEDE